MRGEVDDEREMGARRWDGTVMVRWDDDGAEARVHKGRWKVGDPELVIFVISGNPNLTARARLLFCNVGIRSSTVMVVSL